MEARQAAAEIVGGKPVERLQRTCQSAASERAEGYETDAQFTAGFQHAIFFGIAGPQRIFALNGCNRVNGVRLAKGRRTRLRKAERLHLAFPHQIGHCADRLFNCHVRIDAVLVIEVDDIDTQPFQ
ncbi:hypothetical protein D3C71_823590 [compost metagenome]